MTIGPRRDSLRSFHSHGDALTYETFFGLKEQPFSLASDPRFLYQTRSHGIAFEDLLAGIRRRDGLLVLTGDIGTGKTTLCRAVLQNLDRKTFSAFVPDPFASREDLLKMLLIDFGVMSIQDLTTGPLRGATRTELSYLLSAFLDTLAPLDAFVVVFIDEAQNMSLPLIEEVRILSDSSGHQGQLQFVFVGQLELQDKLKLPEMRQVDQRVCVYSRLIALIPSDVAGYVHHRLQVAGGAPDRIAFSPDALALLHETSGGIPRLINRICDRALHVAHLRRSGTIDRDVVAAALDDIGRLGTSSSPLPTPVLPASAPPAVAQDETPFSTQVEEWLEQAEVNAPAPETLPPIEIPRELPKEPARVAGRDRTVRWRNTIDGELRPQTYMQRLQRRWVRRITIAALWIAVLNAVIAAISYVPNGVMALTELPVLPTLPAKPMLQIPAVALPTPPAPDVSAPVMSGEYFVAVALFATTERADRLAQTLTQAGFRGYQRSIQVGDRVLRQVLLGPFATREEAGADLNRLRETPGYEDARVVTIG